MNDVCPGSQPPHRIGNNRATCRACNVYAQRVRRLAASRLAENHPAEYEAIKTRAETDVYARMRRERR